jgi:uncharacterized C2H2 Zn-finger protein
MSTNPPQNYIYRCDKCQFITSVKRDYQRHIASMKHAKRTETNAHGIDLPHSEPMSVHQNSVVLPSIPQPCHTSHQPDQLAFIFDKQIYKYCEKCGNKYHSKSGLWKHRKTCDVVPVSTTQPSPPVAVAPAPSTTTDHDFKTMMMELLKNNQEFQHKLIEMMSSQQSLVVNAAAAASAAATAAAANATSSANYTNSNNYNRTTNSHNNTFNMQFFLNEQCKDAMNITEFASSIHLKVSDLDDFASMGYVEGMSKLFIDSLRETDVFKRPIHCSDARRETLYVKDDDKWEREGPENTKITNAVRVVEHKNIVLVNEWAKQNPRCENSSTKENTQYINMSRAVLDGDDKNIAKVIKKVAKEVVIEKGPP